MHRVEQYLTDKLNQRILAGSLRALKTYKNRVDLFSNDYLGLAKNGVLTETQHAASLVHYTGSTGSRLLSGNSIEAEALEETIASFHQAEAALLFNSGYDANVGLISCITNRHTTILYDELCHASIIDGIRLSQCNRKYKFAHNDMNELEELLKKYKDPGAVLVITESVFSMDGDTAPLTDIVTLCEANNAQLIVDEAHATGVFGPQGRGLVCELGLQQRVFARVHTFGKALGCHGAAVVGTILLKQYLINFARTFIYTTALPGHSVHTASLAYQHLASTSFTNEPLHELIAYFRGRISESGSEGWKNSTSAIQALVAGGNDKSRKLANKLQEAGLQVNAILHPTVPLGQERLRICLHTFNTKEQVDLLFEKIYS